MNNPPPRRGWSGLWLLPVLALPLDGCRLIDQTTFDPALRARLAKPARPPAAAPATSRPAAVPPPLLSIRFAADGGDVDYADSLRLAVRQALARKPDVQFDVVTVIPADGTLSSQLAVAARDGADARRIAGDIQAMGVDAGQIALGLRPQPGISGHLVQVFVH